VKPVKHAHTFCALIHVRALFEKKIVLWTECAEGKFGQECKQTCTCQATGTQTCQATDGTCVCKPGYKGAKHASLGIVKNVN
jgi:hypothetical protein